MKREAYLCLDCGTRDFEPSPGGIDIDPVDGTMIAEYPQYCPHCQSTEITYGYWECDNCGEAYEHFHEMETENICKACYFAAKMDLQRHIEEGTELDPTSKKIILEVLHEHQ